MASPHSKLRPLQKEWYAKLKEDGFVDIEEDPVNFNNAYLKHVKRKTYQNNETYREAIKEYYYICYQFLHEYPFETEVHRAIWEAYADGATMREIANLLNSDPSKKGYKKSHVHNIVKALETLMRKRYINT